MMDTSYESLLSYMALANDTGTATSSDVDDYDSFVLEYINEADIAALDLLPHLPPRTSIQPADHEYFEVFSSSFNTANTKTATTENIDIPLRGRVEANIAIASPSPGTDDSDKENRPVFLFGHFLIEGDVATTITLQEPDHLKERRKERKEFAERRYFVQDTEPPVEPTSMTSAPVEAPSPGTTPLISRTDDVVSTHTEQGHFSLDAPRMSVRLDDLTDVLGLHVLDEESA
ncbi:hypothetical protein EVJ58_g8950 [Rhodofomes roseus]|uniref:Uncharacterized protein n=1 Tax=Rhodofomes roseus TaxID=34475 RepID=A0A4Y9Y0A2_9APHY|nr:hypothetical protein EVJ58_g8950 [Rhodofomes roseus]